MLHQIKNNKWVILFCITCLSSVVVAWPTIVTRPSVAHTGQVLATVDQHEISMLQFNFLLKKIGIRNPSPALKTEITEKLIDRELAYQMALEHKLEQTPEVLLSIEEAKKDILARAYAERLTEKTALPSENDLARYYNDHPALFAQRKIYHLSEITISNTEKNYSFVKAFIGNKRTKEAFIQWLHNQNISFNAQNVIRAAEQLPLAIVPKLVETIPGQIQFFESPRGLMVYQILSTQDAYISFEKAKPIIAGYLQKQSSKTTVDTEIEHLRRTRPIQVYNHVIGEKVN